MKIKHSISILFMILLLASCKDGLTIFDQIDQETKLEDAVITGSVNSIVRSGDKLYASDGNIYAKSVNAVRDWSKIAGPGGTIIKLAADSNGVYALNNNGKLFYSENGASWSPVKISQDIGAIKMIFSAGSDTFIETKTSNFYELVDGVVGTNYTDIPSTIFTFNQKMSALYYAKEGTIYGTTEAISSVPFIDNDLKSVSGLGTIYSLTYSEAENALYAGTSDGLKKIKLNELGELTGEKQNPPGNWGATINNYEAFAVLATGDAPENAALYTSTIKGGPAYAKINGLWGYYYNRRNNWNRE